MLPNPNFLVSEVELPKEKHIKNPEPRILLLRRKVHFSVFPRRMKTQKLTFLRNIKIRGSGFLICFSLGNSTLLTKKLGLGNIGHMDFWVYDSISGAVQAPTLNSNGIFCHTQ